jgi:hypothetical protein
MVVNLIASVALLVALDAGAAAPAAGAAPAIASAPKAVILGLWKGSSTCAKVEGNEFCHDERIVYNFVDVPDEPATVALKAARIVDGTVQRAFDLHFTYRPDTGDWTCEFDRDKSKGIWTYVVSGDGLTGTATLLPEGKIVRNVTAKRTTKDQVLAP